MQIVVFPWLAMGHLIPFLRLSKLLVGRGHAVWFISTPMNLHRLSRLLPAEHGGLHLVPVTLPSVAGLPPRADSSMDIPQSLSPLLKLAFDKLLPSISSFLASASPPPDWIIHDYASHWLPALAASRRIPSAFFSLFNALATVFSTPPPGFDDTRLTPDDFAALPGWVPFPSPLRLRRHEALRMLKSAPVGAAADDGSAVSDTRRFSLTVAGSHVIVIRTCRELEPEWFDLLPRLYKKPVVPLGLLPPPSDEGEVADDDEDYDWKAVKAFLDIHDSGGVVYAAVGSEARLDEGEAEELRLGLASSGVGYLLVLRGGGAGPKERSVRAEGGGIVYVGWAPQARILRHPAVGGFLTHCGWNSAAEGLAEGRVLILLPLINDQALNCRLLAEAGAGVEVDRDETSGAFTRHGVARAVRLAMVDHQGATVRAAAKAMKTMFTHDDGIQSFFKYLEENKDNDFP